MASKAVNTLLHMLFLDHDIIFYFRRHFKIQGI